MLVLKHSSTRRIGWNNAWFVVMFHSFVRFKIAIDISCCKDSSKNSKYLENVHQVDEWNADPRNIIFGLTVNLYSKQSNDKNEMKIIIKKNRQPCSKIQQQNREFIQKKCTSWTMQSKVPSSFLPVSVTGHHMLSSPLTEYLPGWLSTNSWLGFSHVVSFVHGLW